MNPRDDARAGTVVDEGAVDVLVVGAGVSGLGFVGFWADARRAAGLTRGRVLIVEREDEPGGWCRTVTKDGFVWDYSGHFFHFRHDDILRRLQSRLPDGALTTVVKRARVVDAYGCETSFPYQRAIGELPPDAFRRCLVDLWRAERSSASSSSPVTSFKEHIRARLGDGICERFLIPYNEKLYATDLDTLDKDAMGRFFPRTTFADVMDAVADPGPRENDGAYNATFSYPRAGAAAYVHALLRDVAPGELALRERVIAIDPTTKTATTTRRRIRYRYLVTSAPLPATLQACGLAHDPAVFTWSRVLVLNLGFDAKGRDDVHWIYFADRALPFYRVGFYDNIFGDYRMSLYVEIGLPPGESVDVGGWFERVMDGLRRAGIMTHQRVVSWHHVLMDPAYVHCTTRSNAESARLRSLLAAQGIHSIGRYGAWTYCSIEDNLVEARALARALVTDGGVP